MNLNELDFHKVVVASIGLGGLIALVFGALRAHIPTEMIGAGLALSSAYLVKRK